MINYADEINTGSHIPALKWAIENTVGPVGEFGGGLYSTPLLAQLKDRPVFTVERDPEWRKFLREKYPKHAIMGQEPHLQSLGLLFIDNGEGENWLEHRGEEALRWAHHAEVILIHDCPPHVLRDVTDSFEFRSYYEPETGGPFTVLLSNYRPVLSDGIEGGRK